MLLTPSYTTSLKITTLLLNIQPNNKIIIPNYTFISTTNTFILHNTKIIFINIHPNTININKTLIKTTITNKTHIIIPIHYTNITYKINTIITLTKKHNLFIIKNTTQNIISTYKKHTLKTINHINYFNFHKTKNYTTNNKNNTTLINNKTLIKQTKIIHKKNTNHNQFFHNQINKYT